MFVLSSIILYGRRLKFQLDNVFDLLQQRKEVEEEKARDAKVITEVEAATAAQAVQASSDCKPNLACVVVDTNVLLDDLTLVDEWLKMVHRTGYPTKILVPRAVMLELDGLNHNKTMHAERARKVSVEIILVNHCV